MLTALVNQSRWRSVSRLCGSVLSSSSRQWDRHITCGKSIAGITILTPFSRGSVGYLSPTRKVTQCQHWLFCDSPSIGCKESSDHDGPINSTSLLSFPDIALCCTPTHPSPAGSAASAGSQDASEVHKTAVGKFASLASAVRLILTTN